MRRLSHQLLICFILIALVPFAIVTYTAYAGAERALRAEVTNGLFAIARRQVDAIGAVVRSHERNVTALSRIPSAAESWAWVGSTRTWPRRNSTTGRRLPSTPAWESRRRPSGESSG